jgi:hypothetical protein
MPLPDKFGHFGDCDLLRIEVGQTLSYAMALNIRIRLAINKLRAGCAITYYWVDRVQRSASQGDVSFYRNVRYADTLGSAGD